MSYSLRDDQVSLALDCIVKDVDKSYDECLVEQFLDFIDHEVKGTKDFSHDTEFIIKRLKSYLDHESFQSLNQSRIFKIIHAIIKGKQIDREIFQDLVPILDRLWDESYFLIQLQNLAAVTVLFNILDLVSQHPSGFEWIITGNFNPSIESDHGKIDNLFQLAGFYICHCNNYHTRNSAENFFISLVSNRILSQPTESRSHANMIKESIEKLVFDPTKNRLSIYLRILQSASISTESLVAFKKVFSPSQFIDLSFLHSVDNDKTIKDFCRCLAYYEDEIARETVIHELISCHKFEEIIIYLSQVSIRVGCLDKRLVSYILRPLINQDESTGIMPTPDEELHDVPEGFKKLSPLSGLVHLSMALDHCGLSTEDKLLIINVLPSYILQQSSSKHYKIIMECCSILDRLSKDKNNEICDLVANKALITLQTLYSASEAVTFDSGDTKKPITFALIKLLHNRSLDESQLSDLASRFADEDVIEEISELLVQSQASFDSLVEDKSHEDLDAPASINPALHCSVDDILNYELMSDGIQDCY